LNVSDGDNLIETAEVITCH